MVEAGRDLGNVVLCVTELTQGDLVNVERCGSGRSFKEGKIIWDYFRLSVQIAEVRSTQVATVRMVSSRPSVLIVAALITPAVTVLTG